MARRSSESSFVLRSDSLKLQIFLEGVVAGAVGIGAGGMAAGGVVRIAAGD